MEPTLEAEIVSIDLKGLMIVKFFKGLYQYPKEVKNLIQNEKVINISIVPADSLQTNKYITNWTLISLNNDA